mmetsp:Transcript_66258/g.205160  ORF Transcript_66258/g.205160 Transcript_66258/m.205160 type:complete len:211 (-) Transcript_66258:626-1258(-)
MAPGVDRNRPSKSPRSVAVATIGAPHIAGSILPPKDTSSCEPTAAERAASRTSLSYIQPKHASPGSKPACSMARRRCVASPGAPHPVLSEASFRTTGPPRGPALVRQRFAAATAEAGVWASTAAGPTSRGRPSSETCRRKRSRWRHIHSPASRPTAFARSGSPSVVTATDVPTRGVSAHGKPWNTVQSITPGRLSSSYMNWFISSAAKPG